MNTAPLPRHQDLGPLSRQSAADLAGDSLGTLRLSDRSSVELGFSDACRHVCVSPRTVDDVWRAMAGHLAGPSGGRACLWSNDEIAARAEVSGSQARRALRVLAAFGLIDRQRRYNRSSITSLSESAALRAPPQQSSHARCDEAGCEGCDLGDAQSLLQAHFGPQVWMAGWADELSSALKLIPSPAELVRELTSNMNEIPEAERVKVGRSRLQQIVGKRGRKHAPRVTAETRASTALAHRAKTDGTRATADPENLADAGFPHRALQADRASTKSSPKQVRPPPPSEPRVRLDALSSLVAAISKGIKEAGLVTEPSQIDRWATLAAQHGIEARDLRRGLFAGLESAERPAAVVRWRLTDPDGRAGIASTAAQFREQRRERAGIRLARWRRIAAQRQADERTAAARAEAQRSRADNADAMLARLGGEQPHEAVKGLMCWLPMIEREFTDRGRVSAMMLRRVRDVLDSPDADVVRQAEMLMSDGLARHALGRADELEPRGTPEPAAADVADFAAGRLFALD